jgi:hypothetical protein
MELTIDLRAIKACSFAMSDDPTRYYLNGVALEIIPAHGVVAVATDGSVLITMQAAQPGENTEAATIIVPADVVKRIKISKRFNDATLRRVTDRQWQLEHDGTIYAFAPLEGTFPEWRRILPKHTSATIAAPQHFNPALLHDLQKAGEIYAKGSAAVVVPGEDGSPAWVTYADDVPGFGVIMPFRAKALPGRWDVAKPAWATIPT